MKTNKTEEQLYNRILINFGIGVLAYGFLYYLYNFLYLQNSVIFSLIGIFLVCAIVLYILSRKKPVKNYAHMFLFFALALLFTKLSVLTVTILGMDTFAKLQETYLLKKLLQSRIDVIIISWAGAIYLIGMVVYNFILIGKVSKKK